MYSTWSLAMSPRARFTVKKRVNIIKTKHIGYGAILALVIYTESKLDLITAQGHNDQRELFIVWLHEHGVTL